MNNTLKVSGVKGYLLFNIIFDSGSEEILSQEFSCHEDIDYMMGLLHKGKKKELLEGTWVDYFDVDHITFAGIKFDVESDEGDKINVGVDEGTMFANVVVNKKQMDEINLDKLKRIREIIVE